MDPLRDGVRQAVIDCQTRAGVRVRMCTGDKLETAVAIAKNCAIIQTEVKKEEDEKFPKYVDKDGAIIAMTGAEFRSYAMLTENGNVKMLKQVNWNGSVHGH